MCCGSFPLITLGAVGLGSTWAAIPPKLGNIYINDAAQIAVGILRTLYLGLDVASYIPAVRQIGGIIRIAITILAGFVILPQCKNDYVSSATTMLIGQLARGIFETFVPLPSCLYDIRIPYQPVCWIGIFMLEATATILNITRCALANFGNSNPL